MYSSRIAVSFMNLRLQKNNDWLKYCRNEIPLETLQKSVSSEQNGLNQVLQKKEKLRNF